MIIAAAIRPVGTDLSAHGSLNEGGLSGSPQRGSSAFFNLGAAIRERFDRFAPTFDRLSGHWPRKITGLPDELVSGFGKIFRGSRSFSKALGLLNYRSHFTHFKVATLPVVARRKRSHPKPLLKVLSGITKVEGGYQLTVEVLECEPRCFRVVDGDPNGSEGAKSMIVINSGGSRHQLRVPEPYHKPSLAFTPKSVYEGGVMFLEFQYGAQQVKIVDSIYDLKKVIDGGNFGKDALIANDSTIVTVQSDAIERDVGWTDYRVMKQRSQGAKVAFCAARNVFLAYDLVEGTGSALGDVRLQVIFRLHPLANVTDGRAIGHASAMFLSEEGDIISASRAGSSCKVIDFDAAFACGENWLELLAARVCAGPNSRVALEVHRYYRSFDWSQFGGAIWDQGRPLTVRKILAESDNDPSYNVGIVVAEKSGRGLVAVCGKKFGPMLVAYTDFPQFAFGDNGGGLHEFKCSRRYQAIKNKCSILHSKEPNLLVVDTEEAQGKRRIRSPYGSRRARDSSRPQPSSVQVLKLRPTKGGTTSDCLALTPIKTGTQVTPANATSARPKAHTTNKPRGASPAAESDIGNKGGEGSSTPRGEQGPTAMAATVSTDTGLAEPSADNVNNSAVLGNNSTGGIPEPSAGVDQKLALSLGIPAVVLLSLIILVGSGCKRRSRCHLRYPNRLNADQMLDDDCELPMHDLPFAGSESLLGGVAETEIASTAGGRKMLYYHSTSQGADNVTRDRHNRVTIGTTLSEEEVEYSSEEDVLYDFDHSLVNTAFSSEHQV